MKRLFLLVLLISCIVFSAESQNRSINFQQTKEWKKILKQAKKEKKLIFIDCYTSWCGPCKMLAKDVFTQDSVADYFNRHFVNAKFDIEKDADGVILKDLFAIKAYPTLVFVDPATQEAVHRMVGAGKADWLLEGARNASDPQNNLSGLKKRYDGGEREAKFLEKYLNTLASAYMADERAKVASEYLNTLPEEQFITKENWDIIRQNVNDPLSVSLKRVMANRGKFYEIAGREIVDGKLDAAIGESVAVLCAWRPGRGVFDESRNTELVKYLQDIDCAAAPGALAHLYTAEYVRKGDFRGMLDNMKEAFKYNLFRGGEKSAYFQQSIESLTLCDDKALVQEGINWIDQEVANTDDDFQKASLIGSKARLQTKNGDSEGAAKSILEEKVYNEKGEKKSGGRVMRAIRMN